MSNSEKISLKSDLNINLHPNYLRNPIFNYSRYLRVLNFKELSNCVNVWYVYQFKLDRRDDSLACKNSIVNQLTIKLFKLFMSNSLNLQELLIPKSFWKMIDFSNISISLSNLKKFSMIGTSNNHLNIQDFNCLSSILKNLSRFSNSLETIEIHHFSNPNYNSNVKVMDSEIDIDGLNSLIESQASLKKLLISYSSWNCLGSLASALRSQIGNLTEFTFTNIRFTNDSIFKILASCKNLETLRFNRCSGLTSENLKSLLLIDSPSLIKKLELLDNDIEFTTLFDLLGKSKFNSLRTLSMSESSRLLISSDLIETILTNCPDLQDLDMRIQQPNIFKDILKPLHYSNTTKIRNLRLTNTSPSGVYSSNDFSEISECLPRSLNSLALFFWDFSSESLQKFLENCKCPLKKLLLHKDHGIVDNHLEIITNYAKSKKTLKCLNFTFRSHDNSIIPSEEAVKKAKKIIPLIQGDKIIYLQ
ncbi:9547_t:CDS:1 [Entrophospora sp. SA101]|nr:9547_t:CDS:1 [Entrophospora sp. SA101]CAJ0838887.1 1303_t:CDS:1 [Entrophospora sp. SA101]CAJ0864333.1 15691_t:CDS:1 [Entrophospora sp. SA101]CAJ0878614.1 17404_t:CDS:1 [Entrophospora sp. SA101]